MNRSAIRSRITALAAIALLLLIAGCNRLASTPSTPTFSGTRYQTFSNGSEKLVVNADGTYKQFIESKDHRTFTQVDHWSPSQAPNKTFYTGPWLLLQNYVDAPAWLSAKPGSYVARSTELMSTEGFNGLHTEYVYTTARDRRHVSGRALAAIYVLGILFTLIWIAAILNAAQTRQWVWLILLVLFPCTTVVYGLFAWFFSRALRAR